MEKRKKLKAEPWDMPTLRDWRENRLRRGKRRTKKYVRPWKQVKEVFQEGKSGP